MPSDRPPPGPLPDPSPVEFGGRVELRLIPSGEEAGAVAYAARWFTADLSLEGRVSIHDGSAVKVDGPAELPEWLSAFTTSLVKTTARTAAKESTWPRRLTRWRKAPGGQDDGD